MSVLSVRASKIPVTGPDEMRKAVYDGLRKCGVEEDSIRGIQPIPERGPHAVHVHMEKSEADRIKVTGIEILDRLVMFSGRSKPWARINVFDAPLDEGFDQVLEEFLSEYGTVVEHKHRYLEIDGRTTRIKTGPRMFHMLDEMGIENIPPRAEFSHEKLGKVTVKFWHRGQDMKVCRNCRDIVKLSEHSCAKKCFRCGEEGHIAQECSKSS